MRSRGFTLVEVLVALLILAVLSGMAWRGIDGMARARSGSQQQLERSLRLNTVIAQWEQDLSAVYDSAEVPALAFDGLDGVGDLRFVARAVRAKRENYLVLASDYEQPFGTFGGSLPVAGALHGWGVMERHEALW
jgi:prepilin-type N-terminal cleavage/methylation domain-containing protein